MILTFKIETPNCVDSLEDIEIMLGKAQPINKLQGIK
jgi:hypothetical protein